ncbi:MAG: hypothetical protein JOY92_13870 [Verrucomicrobia bacterium]|nr:hypothetical protein [Verrucomicrobiota bacterium]
MLRLFLLGVMALGLAGFGCVHRRPPDPLKAAAAAAGPALGDDFRTTKRGDVPLYRSGPRQMDIPDTLLAKDTLVRVVRTEFGYSLVRTESGLLGWVASEDLGVPETPPAVAASDTFSPPAVSGMPSPVNRIDARNARASGQNTLPVAPGAGAAPGSPHPETNGDSAIVARYRIDGPAPSPTPEATKPAPSPTPEAPPKAVPSPTPEPSP